MIFAFSVHFGNTLRQKGKNAMKKGGSFWENVKNNFITEDVFRKNEIQANILTAKIMLLNAVVLIISLGLNEVGIFSISREHLRSVVIAGVVELAVPATICLMLNGEKRWLKYLLIVEFTIVQSRIDSVLSYNVVLAMVFPVVLCCCYYSRSFTRQIAILTAILFGVSAYCGAWFGMSDYDLMFQAATKEEYVRNIMLQSYLPKLELYIIIAIICMTITSWGRKMVLNQAQISQEHSRVETELEMAKKIQERALPIVHTLPQQDVPVFDLAAMMVPAKVVGGDFYDFFYIDPTHLVLMIADVSGKGVPAALFMMVAKLLLDNSINSGKSPAQVLAEVNHQLCEKNLENMFVTVWIGILDLETGELVTANAGHEYPLICRKDGSFEVIKDKHGFVLGGMDGMRYKEMNIKLSPGDVLFVYTDGIPEANDRDEKQYGMERTMSTLNANKDKNMDDMTQSLKEDIDAFADGAPQFDDTTMLALRMLNYAVTDGIRTEANVESIETVEEYVRGILEDAEVPMKPANKMNIAVDEVYSNVVNYSNATWSTVHCRVEDSTVTLLVRDNGIPFNPSQMNDPDVTGEAEDREIGGLGIFMVKKLMDTMEYRCENGINELKLTLKF